MNKYKGVRSSKLICNLGEAVEPCFTNSLTSRSKRNGRIKLIQTSSVLYKHLGDSNGLGVKIDRTAY